MANQARDMAAIRVLLVDDDEDDFFLARDLLADVADAHYLIEWESDFDKALNRICLGDHDVILLDYKLGSRTGLDLLRTAREKKCEAPVIILTGMSDTDLDLAAMQSGVADYIEKSRLDARLLHRAIGFAIQQKHVEFELERRVKERTDELDRANVALREADRRKDEFLATLAHELRNPLAPIRNSLEIMRLTPDLPATVVAVQGILQRQVANLVRLIDDLLDVSRITRGKLILNREPVTLSQVLDEAIEQCQPLLEKANQKLDVSIPSHLVWLNGDRIRLAQVFTNILNNASKYSHSSGAIIVRANCIEADVAVSVRDFGVGIPPDALPKIFEPFSQVNRTLGRSQGGLGIGLSLVRQLIQMHGGKVTATSAGNNHGSEFIVRLPTVSGPINESLSI